VPLTGLDAKSAELVSLAPGGSSGEEIPTASHFTEVRHDEFIPARLTV
jgi:hypothetical protein